MNFNEVKSILESLTDLVKKVATLDLQEKIVSLREYIISLKDENISLKEENQALKQQMKLEDDFVLKGGLCWKEKDSVPFCQKCLEASRKPIHLQRWSSGWKCFECDKYYAPEHEAGRAQIFRPDLDWRRDSTK